MKNSLDGLVGNTPLLKTDWSNCAKIYAKMEYFNPAGSIKDRVAKAIIEDAEKSGKLQNGGTMVEATSGNTGIGLAFISAIKGYRCIIVMPETMSKERQQLIKAYGAEIVLTDGSKGMQGAVERAEEICNTLPNAVLAGQFDNPVCAQAHYETTGPEIWQQTDGNVDIVVAGIGTGGTITGIGRYLKEKNPKIQMVGVEPACSPLLTKGYASSHQIQGIGANFVPSVLDLAVVDEIVTVADAAALARTKALGEAGFFVGISSGAAVEGALEIAARPENAQKNIVVILPDGGGRYLSNHIFD